MPITALQTTKIDDTHVGLRKLDYVTFDKLFEKVNPLLAQEPVFDLSDISLITPSGFVRLAAACFALSKDNKRPKIILKNRDVLSYAVRNGFVRTVSPIADIYPPLPAIAKLFYETFVGKNKHLIELTRIASADNIPEVIEKIKEVLAREFNYSSTDAHPIVYAVSEVCMNTFNHNTQVCGFIAMQVYQQKNGMLLEIAISDYGDGLRATLIKNPAHQNIKTDLKAIEEAIKEGVSEFTVQDRGIGLYQLHKIAQEHGHILNIRSGSAKVHFKIASKEIYRLNVPQVPGVHITLCFRPKPSS